jgi:putative endonuclease
MLDESLTIGLDFTMGSHLSDPNNRRPRMAHQPAVYILSNKKDGPVYIGVTSNLNQRIWQHKNKLTSGFSAKYGLDKLVYYELHEEMSSAITREKRLKKWRRQWKLKLVQKQNPHWHDLWEEL